MDETKLKAELIKRKLKQSAIVDHLNKEITTLDKSIEDTETRLADKRLTIADLDSSISFCHSNMADKSAELDTLHNNIATSNLILSDMKSRKSQLDSEIKQFTSDFASSLMSPLSELTNIMPTSDFTNAFTVSSIEELQVLESRFTDSILVVESNDDSIHLIDVRPLTSKVVPFKFYKQVKPMHGRHKTEVYSIDSVLNVINQYPPWAEQLNKKLITEQKFDGVRLQIHKKGDKIKAWTEDGGDITKKLPTLMESLQNVGHDFVIEGEIELLIDDKHQHRSITAGLIHVKDVHPDEQFIRLSTYDLLWFDGNDIHDEEFTDRYEKMEFLDNVDNVQVSNQIFTSSQKQLTAAIKKLSAIPGSEGAMIKLPSYKYELDGTTRDMIKFKKELSLDVKIINKHPVKGSPDTFNYDCVVGKDTYIGKTFNTNTTSKTGIIKVAFGDLFQYTDPKTKEIHFRWVFPRVIEAREDKKTPDSVQTAKDIVKQLDTPIREKRLPELDSVPGIQTVKNDANPYLMLPDPNEDFKFIIQRHYRGESSHLDLRIDTERKLGIDDPQYSILGWTMLDSVAGRVDEPVTTISKAKEFDNKNIWKINWDTGIFKTHKQIKSITPEDTPGYAKLSDDDERAQIESVKKSVHPTAWMTYKGVIDKPEPGEPVPAGATKEFPGVLTIIESGKIEWGCNKPYYHEYFVDGKHLKGRLSFRQLERTVEGKKQLWWTCIQPEDQTPYAISARAVKKEWLPPKGHSALPESIRKKIPNDLQYWNMPHKAALEARKKIVDEIKHGRIVIDCGCTQDKRIDKPELEIEFKLQKQTWKGPTVIRAKPSRTEYHLLLKMPSKYIDFVSEQYPENKFTSIKETAHVLRWRTTGELSPKHKLNKTKATPSKISIVDSGKAKLVLDGDTQKMILTLSGKDLKGNLTATRQGPKTDIWDMVLK